MSAKVDLALRAVADAEQIECSDDDLDAELAQVAERIGQRPDRVRAEFERGGQLSAVRSDVRKRKALDWLLEQVEIVDEDGHAIDRADLEVGQDSDEHDTDETDDAATPAAPDASTAASGDETAASASNDPASDDSETHDMETDAR